MEGITYQVGKFVNCAPNAKTRLDSSYCALKNLAFGAQLTNFPTWCQETDKILCTKNEINVRTKIKIEIARDGPIPIFYDI